MSKAPVMYVSLMMRGRLRRSLATAGVHFHEHWSPFSSIFVFASHEEFIFVRRQLREAGLWRDVG